MAIKSLASRLFSRNKTLTITYILFLNISVRGLKTGITILNDCDTQTMIWKMVL